MKNIIILKRIRSWSISCLLVFITTCVFAQGKANIINAGLKQQPFYAGLPKTYYIAVLPIQGCFACDALLNTQVKDITQNDKIVIIYPSTRKIVQEKIKKENKLDNSKAFYIFDDKLYQKFHDDKQPKGYTLKVHK